MPWTSWLPNSPSHRLCAVGLDIGPDATHLVVLSGSRSEPDSVCCAERLELPEGLVVQGEVLQSVVLGRWLRAYLEAGDYQPKAVYLGLDSTCVSSHWVTLAAGLSPEDVAFQLQLEVQALLPDGAPEVWMDYGLDHGPVQEGVQRYVVQVTPRARVEALQQVAHSAGLKAVVVEPRGDAVRRTQTSDALKKLPQASAALALLGDAAFGLALRAWHKEGTNFLPHRDDAPHVMRRAWLLGMTLCAMGGACLAAAVAVLMAAVAQATHPLATEVATSRRVLHEAQKTHVHVKAVQDRTAAQVRWLQARQDEQSQSLQWSRVLSQVALGVWVVHVQQQGTRWSVQGEALSASHAQQLVQQLKALDIWAQAPELPRLQVMPSALATGLPVWHFRIEADLKAGV